MYEETIRIISNTLIQNPIYKQTGATNLINQKHNIDCYKACFSLKHQKGKRLTEPRVAVRTCAKREFGCRLGSGAKAFQGATPPLGKQHPCNHIDTISFLIVESSNREASSFSQRWSKLLKWCV